MGDAEGSEELLHCWQQSSQDFQKQSFEWCTFMFNVHVWRKRNRTFEDLEPYIERFKFR